MSEEIKGTMGRTDGKMGGSGRAACYPPRERYRNDPAFKNLVDMMTHQILSCNYTPSEMREAAILASIRYEEINIRELRYVRPELEEALATIRKYVHVDCDCPDCREARG